MTDIVKLFSGTGIIIDESINNDAEIPNNIQKIAKSLNDKQIPIVKYEELPSDDAMSNFHSISFLILDWNLSGISPIPEATISDNISFIEKLQRICFIPIFIFSDEDTRSIAVALETAGVCGDNSGGNIFIKSKNELDSSEKLFKELEDWVKNTPSIYVLKEWEMAKRTAKTRMLFELYNAHSAWPNILIKTIKQDGADPNYEFIKLLQNNLLYRINPPELDPDIINKEINDIEPCILRSILECDRFIKDGLPDNPFTGDIYKINDDYYMNIRPDCDIIREKKELYLLKGSEIDEAKINSLDKDAIVFDSGEFIEKINSCYVAFVNGKILEFKFRKIEIKKWADIKQSRIGRLLPPYITKVQQKYSFYLQRQALPAIPEKILK